MEVGIKIPTSDTDPQAYVFWSGLLLQKHKISVQWTCDLFVVLLKDLVIFIDKAIFEMQIKLLCFWNGDMAFYEHSLTDKV